MKIETSQYVWGTRCKERSQHTITKGFFHEGFKIPKDEYP
jgi:hypothetical protein